MDSTYARFAFFASVLLIAGCYQPSPYGGWQGQQQPYMAPQPGYMQSPGTLVIPPSNAPLSAPGTPTDMYEGGVGNEERDGFRNNSDGSFFEPDGGVPRPVEPGSGADPFDTEFRGT